MVVIICVIEMEEEGATESNLIEILQYARPEWIYIILALFACLIQGSVYPVFSLIFNEILAVRVFKGTGRGEGSDR